MALIECPECGHEVPSAATACPNCGHPILQPSAPAPEQVSSAGSGTLVAALSGPRVLSFGLSGTVAGFWWATAALYALTAVFFVVTWGRWNEFVDGDGSLTDLINLEDGSFRIGAIAISATWISGILFIIWFFQAYKSAESRVAFDRTWGAGWTIGAWFIPFANLVIPKLVMNEVDRMSNPGAGEAPIERRWKAMPRLVISDIWWITLLLAWFVWWVGQVVYISGTTFDEPEIGDGYLLSSIASLLLGAAAALIGVVVFVIGKRLRSR